MAVGDAVLKDYQYEFRGYGFGSGYDFRTETVDGLLSIPPTRNADTDKSADHGAYPGVLLYGKRIIDIAGWLEGLAGEDIEEKLALIRRVFQTPRRRYSRITEPFVFQRPGLGKRMCNVRCEKRDIQSNYQTAKGLARINVQLVAPDPIIYSLVLNSQSVDILAGQTNVQMAIVQAGDYQDGYAPIIEIIGPATNPVITHVEENRSIKIDTIVNAAQTLVIDVANRTVTKGGVDDFGSVRNDNQWWNVIEGINTIMLSRSAGNAAANGKLTVRWKDTWV